MLFWYGLPDALPVDPLDLVKHIFEGFQVVGRGLALCYVGLTIVPVSADLVEALVEPVYCFRAWS